MEEQKKIDEHFLSLLISITGAAWQGLGKIPNPMTNELKKDLNSAKYSIDMLEMIKEKTKGNLSKDEERLLVSSLSDLQLNYVDELKNKPPEEKKAEEKKEEEKKPEEEKK